MFLEIIFWLLLLSILYIYALYPLVVYVVAWFFEKKNRTDLEGDYVPYVSFIMAAYNEEEHIEAKIRNCLSLDYPPDKIEIIIGSDGSDDRTSEIAGRYADREITFFPYSARRGKMAVINDCVNHAKGEILVFSDIYEKFEKDAVRKLVRNFLDPSIGAVTGNHISNLSNTGIGKGTILYWRYQRWLQAVESRLATIFSCDGTIYACRKELFMAPPEMTINDDKAVPMGIISQGYRVVFEPEAIARGDLIDDSDSFFNQKVRGQSGMYQIFWMFRSMFIPVKPLQWFIFMSHTVGPVIAPWFLVMLLLTNTSLYAVYPFNIILVLQTIFYLAAAAGSVAHNLNIRVPLLHLPYFFVISNVASLAGFWAYAFRLQKVTWKKVS